MSNVEVDTEKLAHGLERGIGKTHGAFSEIPQKYRLRIAVCGLASTAIHEYSRREDIPSRLVLNRPLLSFTPSMGHVMPLIGERNDPDPTVVDASYSQFFSYVGLDWGYETYSGRVEFPPEKIAVFKVAQRALFTNWMAEKAAAFQRRNIHPHDPELDRDMGEGPLQSADEESLRVTYARIWDLRTSMAWRPTRDIVEGARIVSHHVPSATITIS